MVQRMCEGPGCRERFVVPRGRGHANKKYCGEECSRLASALVVLESRAKAAGRDIGAPLMRITNDVRAATGQHPRQPEIPASHRAIRAAVGQLKTWERVAAAMDSKTWLRSVLGRQPTIQEEFLFIEVAARRARKLHRMEDSASSAACLRRS